MSFSAKRFEAETFTAENGKTFTLTPPHTIVEIRAETTKDRPGSVPLDSEELLASAFVLADALKNYVGVLESSKPVKDMPAKEIKIRLRTAKKLYEAVVFNPTQKES